MNAGHYPHPDVPRVPNAVAVQGGIIYCPDLKFIAYDVAVTHGEKRGRVTCHRCDTSKGVRGNAIHLSCQLFSKSILDHCWQLGMDKGNPC